MIYPAREVHGTGIVVTAPRSDTPAIGDTVTVDLEGEFPVELEIVDHWMSNHHSIMWVAEHVDYA